MAAPRVAGRPQSCSFGSPLSSDTPTSCPARHSHIGVYRFTCLVALEKGTTKCQSLVLYSTGWMDETGDGPKVPLFRSTLILAGPSGKGWWALPRREPPASCAL